MIRLAGDARSSKVAVYRESPDPRQAPVNARASPDARSGSSAWETRSGSSAWEKGPLRPGNSRRTRGPGQPAAAAPALGPTGPPPSSRQVTDFHLAHLATTPAPVMSYMSVRKVCEGD